MSISSGWRYHAKPSLFLLLILYLFVLLACVISLIMISRSPCIHFIYKFPPRLFVPPILFILFILSFRFFAFLCFVLFPFMWFFLFSFVFVFMLSLERFVDTTVLL